VLTTGGSATPTQVLILPPVYALLNWRCLITHWQCYGLTVLSLTPAPAPQWHVNKNTATDQVANSCHRNNANWINWFKEMSILSLSYWESDLYWRPNNKHFAERAPQNGGKQLIWRNYVTVTLCIDFEHILGRFSTSKLCTGWWLCLFPVYVLSDWTCSRY